MDEFVNLEYLLFEDRQPKRGLNLSYIITSCHQNKTIYEVRAFS